MDLHSSFENLGIRIWVDDGWGVDSLLGEHTRRRADLDIAIQQRDLPILRELRAGRGYKDVERDDTSPWNFVLGARNGLEVDVHAVVFNADGNGLYGPIEKEVMSPTASLSGTGSLSTAKRSDASLLSTW